MMNIVFDRLPTEVTRIIKQYSATTLKTDFPQLHEEILSHSYYSLRVFEQRMKFSRKYARMRYKQRLKKKLNDLKRQKELKKQKKLEKLKNTN